ncbi:DASH complex subunit Dad3-domain-containing protein [Aspergillus floccosus]
MDHDPTTPPPARESSSENPLLRASNPLVSDLEQEVLDEYSRLLGNVNKVDTPSTRLPGVYRPPVQLSQPTSLSQKLADLSGDPSSLTLDGLRVLERKTATVCTLLKASVYSIVLQQQIFNESEEQQQHQQQDQEQQEGMGYPDQGLMDEGDVSFTGRFA